LGTHGVLGYVLEHVSWPGPTVSVRIQLGAPNVVLKDGSTSWNSVAANAFALWNEQMARLKVNWTIAAPGTPTRDGDNINEVQFASSVYGDAFGANTVAITVYSSSGSQMREADVVFNIKDQFDSYRGVLDDNILDLHRVALHEFGHVLGLDHPDKAQPRQTVSAIMNSLISSVDNLQPDDIAGIQALYGKPLRAPPATGNGRLANISTRMRVGTGDDVMIGGFVVQGTRAKKVIIRALGPSTRLPGTLANPTLELHDKAGALLQSNDDWRSAQQEIAATGIPPANNLESAIVATLPGNSSYTAIVRGKNDSTGMALLEIYDLDSVDPANSKLANISTRGHVGTGDDVLIAGFIIFEPQAKRVVVRGLGQSSGVAGALVNPTLELRNANGALLQSNDNYVGDVYVAANHLVPPNSLESAFSHVLAPGNYTAILRGVNNGTGIALVEVYGVP
jgi:matrixin